MVGGSNPSAPNKINLLKLSLLGRIRFEISKFHVSIQFLGVYGIYTVEPILYKNGTGGTSPNSHKNGPFLRWTDARLIAMPRFPLPSAPEMAEGPKRIPGAALHRSFSTAPCQRMPGRRTGSTRRLT